MISLKSKENRNPALGNAEIVILQAKDTLLPHGGEGLYEAPSPHSSIITGSVSVLTGVPPLRVTSRGQLPSGITPRSKRGNKTGTEPEEVQSRFPK